MSFISIRVCVCSQEIVRDFHFGEGPCVLAIQQRKRVELSRSLPLYFVGIVILQPLAEVVWQTNDDPTYLQTILIYIHTI